MRGTFSELSQAERDMCQNIQEWTKSNLWKIAFKKFGRPYHFKFFKGCLPQILLGLFLNTLSRIFFLENDSNTKNLKNIKIKWGMFLNLLNKF